MLDNCKSQTGSSVFTGTSFVYPIKTFENTAAAFLGNSDAGISHRDADHFVLLLKGSRDSTARLIVFDAVFHQIQKQFFQSIIRNGRTDMLPGNTQSNAVLSLIHI